MPQVREQTDVDVRLFHHAAGMSTAAHKGLSPVRTNRGSGSGRASSEGRLLRVGQSGITGLSKE